MEPGPFLRWAGGKRQLLPAIHEVLSQCGHRGESRFFEPFIGGGAVFFSLKQAGAEAPGFAKAHLNDANPELANVYVQVRDNVESLIELLLVLGNDISEETFYEVRSSKPLDDVSRAARFIYLNRLCFNGLYRVNRAGQFNVPYGKLKNPVVCNVELLRSCSLALADSSITEGDFATAVVSAMPGDVVYFDPPYVALSKTASFAAYHSDGFGEAEHKRLTDLIDELTAKGVFVILSNSDTPFTRDLFSNLFLYTVRANRSISASAQSRQSVNEILATNFPIHELSARFEVVSKPSDSAITVSFS